MILLQVKGALLHDASTETTPSNSTDTAKPTSVVSTSPTSLNSTTSTTMNLISTIATILNKQAMTPTKPNSTTPNPTIPNTTTVKLNPTTPTATLNLTAPNTTSTNMKQTTTNLNDLISSTALASLTPKEQTQQPSTSDSPQVTTQITSIQPTTTTTNASPTDSNLSSKSSTSFSQDTTSSNKPAVTTNKSGTSPDTQTDPSAVTTNSAPVSTSTESIPKEEKQTTSAPITSTTLLGTKRPDNLATSTSTPKNTTYQVVFDLSQSSEGYVLFETCKKLGQKLKGNCSVLLEFQGNKLFATVTIIADQTIPTESYKPREQKDGVPTKQGADKEAMPDTLIAILASSGALVLILCCFAAYCTYHRRSYRKNQQHLTEELQTVENGYHDNPTLEVMEVQPEMQEKKLALNGEFNDSWIVPIDNLLKEDIPDEEDTHL